MTDAINRVFSAISFETETARNFSSFSYSSSPLKRTIIFSQSSLDQYAWVSAKNLKLRSLPHFGIAAVIKI